MEALLTSTAVVALAEIGDKTQLLAIVLATRFKRPLPIIAGIFVATIANHFLAALVGEQAASFLDGQWFRYLVAASFILMGAWTLIPDKFEETEAKLARSDAAQIPLHPGVEGPPELRPIDTIKTMQVSYAAIATKLQEIQPFLNSWAKP